MNYMWVIYIPFYFTLSSHAVTSVMSDSVRPHRRQPTRLLHPWDPPGESTGVACHFLLQCMKVKSESEVTQSCPTPRDPMDCSLPGSSIHGTLQARVLERIAIAFSSVCVFSHQILTTNQWGRHCYSIQSTEVENDIEFDSRACAFNPQMAQL